MYMEHADDPFQNTKKVVVAAESEPVACSICGKLLANEQLVAGHKWSAQRTHSNIRDLVPDTSKCPICETDYFSRSRLIKHLLEKRVRSKNRAKSCRQEFIDSNPTPVDPEILADSERQGFHEGKAARISGHTNVFAKKPCQRSTEHILKGKPARKSDVATPIILLRRHHTVCSDEG